MNPIMKKIELYGSNLRYEDASPCALDASCPNVINAFSTAEGESAPITIKIITIASTIRPTCTTFFTKSPISKPNTNDTITAIISVVVIGGI